MIIYCFPFISVSLVRLMQPRRSAPKDGDSVTAARDPGRVTAILYSRLATSHRSLAIILPRHIYIYYHSHPRLQPYANIYHTYTYEAECRHACPHIEEELRLEARVRRIWVNRVSELRTGRKLSIGCFLLLYLPFSSLLFSSLYFITSLDLAPVLMASAQVFTTS